MLALTLVLSTLLAATAEKPHNVILIIGDGMSSAHFTAARHIRGKDFRMGQMPVSGWVGTSSANSIVTDSGAAATALATGQKTNNRMVGVDPSGKRLMTALELAEKTGRATGLVTTAEFFDATPASFAAHNTSRYERQAIAREMLRSGAEIIAGGGAELFGGEHFSGLTLAQFAEQMRYQLVTRGDALQSARGDRILVCFPTQPSQADWPEASLPTMARWTLERLSADRDGFFVLFESEGTDGSGHHNDTEAFRRSVISVDETVGVALDFAKRHPRTLVLVTGDHGTGALQIQREKPDTPMELVWSTRGHTGEAVPIFAQGPGAGRFTGLLENSDVGKRLIELLRR